jgi:hypothetical protein
MHLGMALGTEELDPCEHGEAEVHAAVNNFVEVCNILQRRAGRLETGQEDDQRCQCQGDGIMTKNILHASKNNGYFCKSI